MTYTVKSPAKINIGLRVLSKRKDGYHDIETIFHTVKIFDLINVKIKSSKNTKITVKTNLKKINNENNICYKAVELFLKTFKIEAPNHIDIRIQKKIPIGAGLGGGSSNAASILKILTRHFAIKERYWYLLRKIALELGSDVPFFLIGNSCHALSRGELLTKLPLFKIRYRILIVNPGIEISTKWAYKALRVRNTSVQVENKLDRIYTFTLKRSKNIVNDFEDVVFKKNPGVKHIKEKMYKTGAVFSLMSGSGSTVFGFYKKEARLSRAQNYFKKKKYKTFIS